MYELSGKIKDCTLDFRNGNAILTLSINEKSHTLAMCDELRGCEKLSIEIDKYRDKRSNDANRYFWHLCGKLAEKLSEEKVKYTKDDIYRKIIKESGIYYDDEVDPDKVKWRRTAWELIGTGWLTERVDFSQDGNKEIIRFYYGSSRYNTKQMSRLIDNVVQDCQAQGIETKTPSEIANMLSLWKAGE